MLSNCLAKLLEEPNASRQSPGELRTTESPEIHRPRAVIILSSSTRRERRTAEFHGAPHARAHQRTPR